MHMFTQAEFNQMNKICNWKIRSDNAKNLKHEEFYELVKDLIEAGYAYTEHKTINAEMKRKSYSLTRYKTNYFYLCYKNNRGQVKMIKTHALDDKKNLQQSTNELTKFKNDFFDRHGIKFKDNFGAVDHSWKRLVPGLFHADNADYQNCKVKNVGKVDFSSHFVACSLGSLPDANTLKVVDHFVEPDEEYQFAFYPDSGNIAEYKTFNSRSWLKSYSKVDSLWKSENDYFKKDTKTYLMKPAKFTLDEQLLKMYEKKRSCAKDTKEYQEAKLLMLKLVGKFEMNEPRFYENNPYCHLAAIIKGRAIQRMIDTIKRIGNENVIQVIVDGLIYNNYSGIRLGDENEFLGSLKQECFQAKAQFRLHNQYILEENGIINKCHAGLDTNIESNNIKDWKASGNETFRAKLNMISKIEYLGRN